MEAFNKAILINQEKLNNEEQMKKTINEGIYSVLSKQA